MNCAPVQIFDDFPNYYTTIQRAMPKNCSADLALIINHVDTVLTNGTKDDIYALKKQFGMQDVVHDDDFAVGLSTPLSSWQSMQPYTGYSQFFMMCDATEGANGTAAPGPDGVGLPAALNNFAEWWIPNVITGVIGKTRQAWAAGTRITRRALPIPTGHLQTPLAALGRGCCVTSPYKAGRLLLRTAQPLSPALARLSTTGDSAASSSPTEGQNTYGLNSGKTAADVNSKYDGWLFTNTTRMVWTNGELDPLLDATVSSEIRPGGPLQSSAGVQVYLIPGAHHATDLFMKNGDLNADIKTAITGVVSNLTTWVNEFYDAKKPAASGQA
ncbi:putative serine carboxypeptidase S28 [Colletotrichum sublineola]|uniref:Putative serine carboxypeptidase S28 n=1 Tax=Colletotrichum sublineola TaxID=1173701 RepID=A0A066XQ60_COLSU|nr:putative serine carboxypeptidase S28 [Colletotrichum sublineola]